MKEIKTRIFAGVNFEELGNKISELQKTQHVKIVSVNTMGTKLILTCIVTEKY